MKPLFILILFAPLFAFSQKKTKPAAKKNIATAFEKPVNGYLINGDVTGYADGTQVYFYNEQTGQPEQKAVIKSGKFSVAGELQEPAFQGILLGSDQPMLVLFLDNSVVSIKGNKSALDSFVITGSPSHSQYPAYPLR